MCLFIELSNFHNYDTHSNKLIRYNPSMNQNIRNILKTFEEISKIPRCSKHEKEIGLWIEKWAEKHNFYIKKDEVGNILITIPESCGYENAPIVILQGHMDMVCEKTPDSIHNFSTDAIRLMYNEHWIQARDTTLGADNGIAIAIVLELATDPSIEHPKLELLFTVDEETSMQGANKLSSDFILGNILVNLDSEEEGSFIIGCAGGMTTTLRLPSKRCFVEKDMIGYKLTAEGMVGGHSGVNIHENRANANKVLAHVLNKIINSKVFLINIYGGNAHNAIPNFSKAMILISSEDCSKIENIIKEAEQELQKKYYTTDPNIHLKFEEIEINIKSVIEPDIAQKIIQLLLELPHGIINTSYEFDSLVKTSNNLATIYTKTDEIIFTTTQRSSDMDELNNLIQEISKIGDKFGAKSQHDDNYPAWKPNINSPLLEQCIKVYTEVFDKKPVVKVIHAGLECAVIGSKFEEIDMISFGPTIENPHSPDERLYIPSVENTWKFLIALVKDFRHFKNLEGQ